MTNQELKQLQSVLLDMYKDLYAVCKKYRLIPYLCGGSALGAIRHHGFIPWDDDLDVAMTRFDFNILSSVFEFELGDKYILNAPNHSRNAKARFPKMIKKNTVCQEVGSIDDEKVNGIFIDIFIIDSVPDNYFVYKGKGYVANGLEFIGRCVYDKMYLDEIGKELIKRSGSMPYYVRTVFGTIFSFQPASKWFDFVDAFVNDASSKTKRCGLVTGSKHYFGEVFKRKAFFPPRYVRFCDMKAPVFYGVIPYLKNLYGDYKKIPEEKDRVTHNIKRLVFS